jgi:mono/diheme cytochrome c family protein
MPGTHIRPARAASRLVSWLAPLLTPLLTAGLLLTPGRSDAARATTYTDLAPLLQSRCTVCHSGTQAAAGLQLDSLDALQRGSSRGPVVRPGDPAGSELIRRLRGQSLPRMPLTGPPYLGETEIQRFEDWIRAGLPAGDPAAPATARLVPPPAAARPAVPTWTDVAPIFATRCAKCHRDGGLMGAAPQGYRLTGYDDVLASDEQVRVVPGRPEASELVRRIRGLARPRMPFDGPPYLNEAEISLISDWIRHGARNSLGEPAPMPTGARLRLRGSQGQDGLLESLGGSGGSSGRRRDRLPGPDDDFELRGWVAPDGSIEVERLRRR